MLALARLRAIIDDAFIATANGETPEVKLARCKSAMAGEFARILSEEQPETIRDRLGELSALADECRDRSRTLPEDEQRQHFEWLRRDRGWYKVMIGDDGRPRAPDLPHGTLSVPLEFVPALYKAISALRYGLHRLEHPFPCNCAAIHASGLERKPQCPELIPTQRRPIADSSLMGHILSRHPRDIRAGVLSPAQDMSMVCAVAYMNNATSSWLSRRRGGSAGTAGSSTGCGARLCSAGGA